MNPDNNPCLMILIIITVFVCGACGLTAVALPIIFTLIP